MRFTLYVQPLSSGPERDATLFETVVQQAQTAARAGFVGASLTEHHFTGYNTYSDNFLLGSYLAPLLPRHAYVVLTVAVVPLHHPIRLAEQCNFLDLATRGRCIIGLGPGLSFVEYGGFGQSVPERYVLMDRSLEIFFRALSQRAEDPPLCMHTPAGDIELQGRITPSSFRMPHPQLGRASTRDESIVETARHGWVLMTSRLAPQELAPKFALYSRSLDEAELSEVQVHFCREWSLVQKMVHVAPTDAEAREDVEAMLPILEDAFRRGIGSDSALKAAYARAPGAVPQALPSIPPDHDAFVRRTMIVGSPDTVTAQIEEHNRAGVQHIAVQFLNGYLADDTVAASFDLFLERVLPRFPTPRDELDLFVQGPVRA